MQFDSKQRNPIFYVILFGMLIFAIVFFVNSVTNAVRGSSESQENTTSQVDVNDR